MQLSIACDLLHEVYGEKSIILIDDYDSLTTQLLENPEKLNKFTNIYVHWLQGGLKSNEFVYSSVTTGAIKIDLLSGVNNLEFSHMFERDRRSLIESYFFTESELKEFHQIVLREEITEEELNALKNYYNGYLQPNHDEPLYNPHALATYYRRRYYRPFDPNNSFIEPYWA